MYANQLKSLPQDYYPWFDTCHVLLCVLAVRKEAGRGFAWTNPFSCWLSCIVASFAGSIICNPLLGNYQQVLFEVRSKTCIVMTKLDSRLNAFFVTQ